MKLSPETQSHRGRCAHRTYNPSAPSRRLSTGLTQRSPVNQARKGFEFPAQAGLSRVESFPAERPSSGKNNVGQESL
jgi:hypothetical protein